MALSNIFLRTLLFGNAFAKKENEALAPEVVAAHIASGTPLDELKAKRNLISDISLETDSKENTNGLIVVIPGNGWGNTLASKHAECAEKAGCKELVLRYQHDKSVDEIVEMHAKRIAQLYDEDKFELPIHGRGYSVGGILGAGIMEKVIDEIKKTERYTQLSPKPTIVKSYMAMNTGRSISALINSRVPYLRITPFFRNFFGAQNIDLEETTKKLANEYNVACHVVVCKKDSVIPEGARPFEPYKGLLNAHFNTVRSDYNTLMAPVYQLIGFLPRVLNNIILPIIVTTFVSIATFSVAIPNMFAEKAYNSVDNPFLKYCFGFFSGVLALAIIAIPFALCSAVATTLSQLYNSVIMEFTGIWPGQQQYVKGEVPNLVVNKVKPLTDNYHINAMWTLGLNHLGLNFNTTYDVHSLTLAELKKVNLHDSHEKAVPHCQARFRGAMVEGGTTLDELSKSLGIEQVTKKANEQIGISETGEKPSPN